MVGIDNYSLAILQNTLYSNFAFYNSLMSRTKAYRTDTGGKHYKIKSLSFDEINYIFERLQGSGMTSGALNSFREMIKPQNFWG